MNRRHRIVTGTAIKSHRVAERWICAGAALREVAPAVIVGVNPRIVDAARYLRCIVLVFPEVFHEVVVGEHLAEVEIADAAEVVGHKRS